MYFFPNEEFQIRENKFIKSALWDEPCAIYIPRDGSVNPVEDNAQIGRIKRL